MSKIMKRIETLAKIMEASGKPITIAFTLDGATDDDVVAVFNSLGKKLFRGPGETTAQLVRRMIACNPFDMHSVIFVDYTPEALERLGGETLPDLWIDPEFEVAA